MSDDKKPKKDLRARLGRTIAPNTPGAAPIAPPTAAPVAAPAAVRPAASSGGGSPSVVAPPVMAPPMAAPAAKMPFGGPDVAPPPFAQPAARHSEPPRPKAPSDPFASGPSNQGPQEVRLVIDEKPVDDNEVGKRNRGRNFLLVGLGLMVGALLGLGFGSVNSRNVLYNVTVRDGHEIYDTVNTASAVVLQAQQKIDQIVERAAGGPGRPGAVDYAAIQELQGLALPIHAGAFARKNYGAFNPGTVDDLFTYYNNVQILWADHFVHLAATTLPEARRTELDRTATAASEQAQYGVIPVQGDEGIMATLVFVEAAAAPAGEGAAQKVMARPRRGGTGRELELFVPGTTIGTAASHVMLLDGAQSAGVLSEQLGAFRSYINDIREMKVLMDQTVEVQGRLTTSLSEIARLEEVFAM